MQIITQFECLRFKKKANITKTKEESTEVKKHLTEKLTICTSLSSSVIRVES